MFRGVRRPFGDRGRCIRAERMGLYLHNRRPRPNHRFRPRKPRRQQHIVRQRRHQLQPRHGLRHDSFYYYVSTDALNDPGQRGLWYFDEGINTQLSTIPFSDSGDGDATLSANGSTFFVTTDDGDATSGDSLYAFSNLGGVPTFTEIGETGLSQIIGLAVNPVTGIMYGYDSSTEALYTIDPEDGTPTLVGTSGMSLAAIGGMDFSADGSTLLLSSGRNLFTVNTSDGSLTAAGDALLNISALSYRAPIPAPATATLLALGGIVGFRRRR